METPQPELVVSNGLELIHCDPDAILAKRKDFLGTAALVEELLPYYQHAIKKISPSASTPGGAAQKIVAAAQGDFSRLPAATAKETREHLRELQGSAFAFESTGDAKRAQEIRSVAETLYSMLKTIQQLGQCEAAGTGKPANGNGVRTRNGS